MADTAARLTEEVLPRLPVRQWVLSFPYEIRYRLAWEGSGRSRFLVAGTGAASTSWPGIRGGPGLNGAAAAPAGVMVLQFEG